MKKWKLTWIVMAVAVAVLALAGVALSATNAPSPAATPGAGVDCGVTDDPNALAELQALRTEFWEARQAWFDDYGAVGLVTPESRSEGTYASVLLSNDAFYENVTLEVDS